MQAKRELLDRELDLITHEQTGEDTTELRHRVEELKKEVSFLLKSYFCHQNIVRFYRRDAKQVEIPIILILYVLDDRKNLRMQSMTINGEIPSSCR